MARADENSIKEYLLGRLTEPDEEQVELRLLTDLEFVEEYDIVVNEVIDDYVAGKFEGEDLKQVEEYFFKSQQRRNKLKFALALKRRESEMVTIKGHKQKSYRPYLAIAATLLLVVGGFSIWRVLFSQSEVDKGLAALQSAYRDERPLEARISRFEYAPYVTTRGPGQGKVDQNELRRAELTLLQALKDNPTPAAHYALGKVFLVKKDFDGAIKEFDQALKGDPNNAQLYSDLGAASLEKGKVELEREERSRGIEQLGISQDHLSKALELDPSLLEALFNRAFCRQYLMLGRQAEEDWREYLKRDSTSPWAEEARRNLQALEGRKNQKSQVKDQRLQDFSSAYELKDDNAAWATFSLSRGRTGNVIVETLLDEHLSLAKAGRNEEAETKLRILSYAGKLESDRVTDRYTSDLARFYSSIKQSDREVLSKARNLIRRANELYSAGEFDDASKLYGEAKISFTNIGDDCEALWAESLIGYCRLRTMDREKASTLFERLVRTFEERQYLSLASQSLQALADAASSLKEFSKTIELANRALKQAEKIEDGATVVHCLAQLLSMHLALGDYRRSLDYFVRASSVADRLPRDPKLVWPIYYDAGLSFHLLEMPSTAFAFENEALDLANEANVALLRSRSWERLGILNGEQGKYDEAIMNGERALAESQEITSPRAKANMMAHSMLRLGQLNNQVRRPFQAHNYFDQALALYEELGSELYLYEARKGKLIADLQVNDDAAADAEIVRVLDLFEKHREKITDETSRNKFFDAGQNTYDLAIDFAYRKKSAEEGLTYAEASRARSLFEMMRAGVRVTEDSGQPEVKLGADSKPLSYEQIRLNLPKQAQLLEYSVLNDKVIIWVVTRSTIESAAPAIHASDLEREVQSFVSALSQSGTNREAVIQQAKELYATLIAPVERYLDRNLLITVIPDKTLNYLPFEALVSPTAGRFFVEDYRMQRAPSATIFIESSRKASELASGGGNEKLLSVGNPKFDRTQFGSLPDLPAAAREAEQVARFYPPATPLVGQEATAGRVRRLLPASDIIHLATHAVADDRSPLLSKLLVAVDSENSNDQGNGILTAAEIYQTKLPRTRLVILSACRTGIERAYRGEGAIGLARPFMVAGVPLVVASLWPVDSEATANLMISFHKHRKQAGNNVPTVEALRLAQLEMIHNSPPNSPPSFGWAAFVAIGGYATF